jgi:hypothetical protein
VTWEPDYITVAQLKNELRIPAGDTQDDAQLARWVTSASRAVDGWAHRQFGVTAVPEQRRYTARWDRHECAYFASVDDLQNIAGLAILAGINPIIVYTLLPLNNTLKGYPFEEIKIGSVFGEAAVDITATWGWTAVPASVQEATMLQAVRFAARRDSPFGIAGSPAEGSEMRLQARVDPDVEVVLNKKLRREWWAR